MFLTSTDLPYSLDKNQKIQFNSFLEFIFNKKLKFQLFCTNQKVSKGRVKKIKILMAKNPIKTEENRKVIF